MRLGTERARRGIALAAVLPAFVLAQEGECPPPGTDTNRAQPPPGVPTPGGNCAFRTVSKYSPYDFVVEQLQRRAGRPTISLKWNAFRFGPNDPNNFRYFRLVREAYRQGGRAPIEVLEYDRLASTKFADGYTRAPVTNQPTVVQPGIIYQYSLFATRFDNREYAACNQLNVVWDARLAVPYQ